MEALRREELNCLRHLVQGGHDSRCCAQGVLLRLLRLGFIAARPRRWLPLENPATEYVPTLAGRQLLARLDAGG